MNVYQKVLIRVYEETGGKDTKAADLKVIVKDLGFFPSYDEIFSQLSHEGWITDAKRGNEVNITPWGVRAAKKIQKGGGDAGREIDKAANQLKSEVKELLVMTEELAEKVSDSRISVVSKKLRIVSDSLEELKKLA